MASSTRLLFRKSNGSYPLFFLTKVKIDIQTLQFLKAALPKCSGASVYMRQDEKRADKKSADKSLHS